MSDPNLMSTQLSETTKALISLAINAIHFAQAYANEEDYNPIEFASSVREEALTALKKAGYDDEMLEVLGLGKI